MGQTKAETQTSHDMCYSLQALTITPITTYVGHSSWVSWLVHSHHQATERLETVRSNPCVFQLHQNNTFTLQTWTQLSSTI